MNYENILIEKENGIAVITINRPTKLNALNKATIEELHKAFRTENDDKSVKVIIITGSGEKAFVAGADISEFANFSIKEGGRLAAQGQEMLFDFVQNLETPVIAAVNGFALGGGLELAMAAHFRVASENAKMGLPEVSLGVIPGYGGTQRLPQLIGKGRAMEMIMTAGMIDAQTALNYGLVNHVVAQEELLDFVKGIAGKITNTKRLQKARRKDRRAGNGWVIVDGYLMAICLPAGFFASSFRGGKRVSTPSSYRASILSLFSSSGRVKLPLKKEKPYFRENKK